MYYFDQITCNFYPAEGAESYYPDVDFSQMKQVDEATFQRIINGNGARAADDDGNPILIPNAPSQYHIWNGTEWVISGESEVGLLTEQRNQIRTQINTKRDACVNGGVYVPEIGKWVDTDEKGRATLVEIKADFDLNGKTEENGEPRIFTLICADNTAQPLDFDKFKAVWNAAAKLKESMFENAYMHKILLEQAEKPLEYDWSIGWAETFEEHQNAQIKTTETEE
ncbi:DUF4376 domain-containing protein [Gallibacterium genomosp. 1]|uniref:DUF4376 domain-containing protein n=1 Tax=Gallibacterium genomosp. 1 TaxID=155515 RepID=UPI00080285BD|nr:DUF4376 domain-containing protein [Gallibacterium genomosp. 1]